ncbi:MAG: sensor histidine kinase [Chitinophagaceae bacterium]
MNAVSFVQNLHKTKNGRPLLHLCFWMFFYLSALYLQSISFSPFRGISVFLTALKQTVTTVIIFYPLVYWVWPVLWFRKKYFLFGTAIIILIVVYTTIDFWLERALLEYCQDCMERIKNDSSGYFELLQRGAVNTIILRLVTLGIVYQMFIFLALPITVKIFMEYLNQRLTTLELQEKNTRLELNFLKAQVNPHFLFNTLNNIYGLILNDKKEQSADTVARLSSFLRYSLYDNESHISKILTEINLLKDYIALEKIRLNEVVVNFVQSIDDESCMIPPLLFMPAIENAFKFCDITDMGDPYIFINFTLVSSMLEFRISNTYQQEKERGKERGKDVGGIGLDNLKKRLSRYYPGNKHSLQISEEDGIFMLFIKINLA